ncbi:MAG TPA: EamA family transporter [Ktedonobacteraceae bacterium]|nr:EamA family transporter [Ktedonobacteraceae bacterium]
MRGRKSNSYRLVGYLMIATAASLFGLNGNLSRLLFDDGISPITLVEFRMLIGALCLFSVLLISQRKGLKLPRHSWGWIVAFGLSLALVTYTYFVAISRLPLAIALVIQFTAPAWMVLGVAIWRRHLPSLYVLAALGLTFGGVFLLTGLWHASLNGLDPLGLVYCLFAVVAYIAYLLLGRQVGKYVPSLTATAYGALVASIFWFSVQPPWAVPHNTWSAGHLFLILLVGIIGMAIPFWLVLGSLRRIDAPRVGIASMLELVAGGIIAYFWLGQLLDVLQIVGCVLVMGGVIILQYESSEVPEVKIVE